MQEQSELLSVGHVPSFKKPVMVLLAVFLIICFLCSQNEIKARLFPMYNGTELEKHHILNGTRYLSTGIQPSHEHTLKKSAARTKNLMFIKTHKCGTSTLVNAFYLAGVRRKLNYVVQRSHELKFSGYPSKDKRRYKYT